MTIEGKHSFFVDTHVHADHRSMGRKPAAATGAEYVLLDDEDEFISFTVAQIPEPPVGVAAIGAVNAGAKPVAA